MVEHGACQVGEALRAALCRAALVGRGRDGHDRGERSLDGLGVLDRELAREPIAERHLRELEELARVGLAVAAVVGVRVGMVGPRPGDRAQVVHGQGAGLADEELLVAGVQRVGEGVAPGVGVGGRGDDLRRVGTDLAGARGPGGQRQGVAQRTPEPDLAPGGG